MTTSVIETPAWSPLRILANGVGPAGVLALGIVLAVTGSTENLFTFLAWGTLDAFIGFEMLKAGSRKDAVLPLLYAVIALFVVAMIYRNGQWTWGTAENICLVGLVLALYMRWKSGPVAAILIASITMVAVGIPIFIANWYAPQMWEWWLWVCGAVSASLSLRLSHPWNKANMSDWMFALGSNTFSFAMLALLLLR